VDWNTERLKKEICDMVVSAIDFSKEMTEEEIYELIDNAITSKDEKRYFKLNEILKLRQEVFNSIKRFDVLQQYLDDESITEVMVNGFDSIFIERNGCITKTEKAFESSEKLEDVIQQIVAGCNRVVNEASPIQDARLSTGERVNVVLPPIALNGPIVTIRRFPKNPITMEMLINIKTISNEAALFLKELVKCRYNIFISGGTGTGKTTFLNALSQYIPEDERIITIEDSAELQLLNAENLVRLETRNRNSEGCKEISIRDLIKTALRMRPDRIIVGEVRGSEAVDMLQAMNTGHDGSLSTGHGNSSKDMIARLETMVLSGMEIPLAAIRGQIASGIDIYIHLERLRDKRRIVAAISETEGISEGEIVLNTLFEWNGTELVKINELMNRKKIGSKLNKNGLQSIQTKCI